MNASEAQAITDKNLLPTFDAIRESANYILAIIRIREEAEKGRYDYLTSTNGEWLQSSVRKVLCADGFKIKELNLGTQFYVTWAPDWYKIV